MKIQFKPCTDIQAKLFIKSFWQSAGSRTHQTEIILPKGVIEIIFSFSDPVPFSRTSNDHLAAPRSFIQGMSNSRLFLKALPEQELFGIELHPPALKKLLKIPSGEFLNTIVDVETINKDFKLLWELLAVAHSFDDRVHIAEQWMIKNISIIHARDMAVSSFLDQQLPAMDVSSLAAQLCYSPRQLHRKSREYFGMSTEALISYKRYLDALRLMHNSKESLTSISYESQYFDQPHFNREFKEYTGLTPGEYRNRKSNLPGHLFE